MAAISFLLPKLDIHWLYDMSFWSMTKYRDGKHSWTSDVLSLKWNFNYGSEDGWKFTLLETTKSFRVHPINNFSKLVTRKPTYQLWYKQCVTNKSLESKLVTVTASDLHLWFSVLEPTSLVHFWLCCGLQLDQLFERVLFFGNVLVSLVPIIHSPRLHIFTGVPANSHPCKREEELPGISEETPDKGLTWLNILPHFCAKASLNLFQPKVLETYFKSHICCSCFISIFTM